MTTCTYVGRDGNVFTYDSNSGNTVAWSTTFDPCKWEDEVFLCVELDDAIEASLNDFVLLRGPTLIP